VPCVHACVVPDVRMSIQALQQLRDSDKVLMQRTAALEAEVKELRALVQQLTQRKTIGLPNKEQPK
jgi:phage shock protein A